MFLKLGNLELDSPKLVATLTESAYGLVSEGEEAYLQGADILELRLDMMQTLPNKDIWAELARIPLPKIITARHPEEGGRANLTEEARLNILTKQLDYADAVDIELQSESTILDEVIKEAKERDKKIIISYHNILSTPQFSYLEAKLSRMLNFSPHICKIATFVTKKEDLKILIDFCCLYSSKSYLVVTGMGEISKISRIILPFFGSLFTYTYISKPTAEGQLPLSQIKPLFMEFLGKLPTPL